MRWYAGLALVLATGASFPVHAVESACNPAEHLKPETIRRITDDYSRFAILSSSSLLKEKDKKIHLNSEVYSAYGISNQSVDSTDRLTERMQKSLSLELTESHREWLIISRLDKGGVEAYKACLDTQSKERQPWSIVFKDFTLSNRTFFVEISFNPGIVVSDIPFSIKLLNGKIVDGDGEGKISSGSSFSVAVQRDLGDVFQMTVSGGGKTLVASLPAAPKHKLIKQTAISPPADNQSLESFVISLDERTEVNSTHGKTVCVALDNADHDAFFVPGSLQVIFTKSELGQHYGFVENAPTEMDRRICKKIEIRKTQVPGRALVTGYLQATYLKPVPLAR